MAVECEFEAFMSKGQDLNRLIADFSKCLQSIVSFTSLKNFERFRSINVQIGLPTNRNEDSSVSEKPVQDECAKGKKCMK